MSDYIYLYLPELNYHFPNYWKQYGEIEFKHVNIPEAESNEGTFLPENSFIEMLFNNNYLSDASTGTYNYLFKQHKLWELDNSTYARLKSSKNLIQCYVTDQSTGDIDLYSLSDSTSETRLLLDQLLEYRLGNSIDLSGIVYEDLEINFSKLLYNYLDLVGNGTYSSFDNTTVLSDTTSCIDNMFELYLLNETHKLLRVKKEALTSDTVELRPVRVKYFIEDQTSYDYITITPLPYDLNKITVLRNGEYIDPTYYTQSSDSSSVIISLDSTGNYGINKQKDDVFCIDYYERIDL